MVWADSRSLWGWEPQRPYRGWGAKPDWYSEQPNANNWEGLPGFDYKYYQVNGETWWHEDANEVRTEISFQTSPYEMFAYLAHDLEVPLGARAMASEGGPISADVDLSNFGFGSDHSGQWTSDLMSRRDYWRQLMQRFGLELAS